MQNEQENQGVYPSARTRTLGMSRGGNQRWWKRNARQSRNRTRREGALGQTTKKEWISRRMEWLVSTCGALGKCSMDTEPRSPSWLLPVPVQVKWTRAGTKAEPPNSGWTGSGGDADGTHFPKSVYTAASTIRTEVISDTGALIWLLWWKAPCLQALNSIQIYTSLWTSPNTLQLLIVLQFYSRLWSNTITSDLYKMCNKLTYIRTLKVHFPTETQNVPHKFGFILFKKATSNISLISISKQTLLRG